jgi:DNA-binding XRE family transcriptional regulator
MLSLVAYCGRVVITWTELKDARALRGWTQQELADALGVHQKTIVNWESKGVPPKSAYKVQRVLGDELAFVEHHERNPEDPTSFEDFRAEWLRQQAVLDAETEAEAEGSQESKMDVFDEYQLEQQQAAYDARVALQDTLAQFDTVTLLREVELRVRRLQADARGQGTGS